MIKKNYKNIKGAYIFDTNKSWKTIAIFWGIHWDEVSWVKAALNFIDELEKGNIKLEFWKVIIIPKCNEIAIEEGKRYSKFNLNRLFFNWEKWNSYEETRSDELIKILDESDYLLDLHSTSGPSIPFLFSESKNLELSKQLWVSNIILWWWELSSLVISWDTENYINNKWWVWFTFEAWNHCHIDATENAFNMILNFLSVLGIISKDLYKKIWDNTNIVKMDNVYISQSTNFKYLTSIENFSKITKWTLIWIDNSKEVYAEEDMILIMPKDEKIIEKWVEVFFIAKSIGNG